MVRRLFSLASAMSLVLCVATSALWIAGCAGRRELWSAGDANTAAGYRTISTNRGALTFRATCNARAVPANPGGSSVSSTTAFRGWDVGGFHYHEWATVAQFVGRDGVSNNRWLPGTFGNPAEFWFELSGPLLVAAILPATQAVRLARREFRAERGALEGVCRACGYDLRASPDRCPECGAVTASAARAPAPSPAAGQPMK